MNELPITSWLTILNMLLVIGGTLGAAIAFRSGRANAERAVETRVREMLNDENKLLQDRYARLEKELARVRRTMQAILKILEDQGLHMEVRDDVISLTDERQRRGRTVSMRIDSGELPMPEEKKP
jgi:hypothetical protein